MTMTMTIAEYARLKDALEPPDSATRVIFENDCVYWQFADGTFGTFYLLDEFSAPTLEDCRHWLARQISAECGDV